MDVQEQLALLPDRLACHFLTSPWGASTKAMSRLAFVHVCCLMTVVWGVSIRPGIAVVVSSTLENTTRPPEDPGWDNIGTLNTSTAVYLGNRWVITASHVGPGTVVFPDLGSFSPDPSSTFRLQNPPGSGLSTLTDLVMFQLLEDPGLPPIAISGQTPPAGTELTVVGHGRNRAAEETYWKVREAGRWTWTETSSPSDYSGFKTIGSNSIRWGTNLLEDDEPFRSEDDEDITIPVETLTNVDVIALITEFDGKDGKSDESIEGPDGEPWLEFESQAVVYDSGGGLFYDNGGMWELAGITVAVEGFNNQPDVRTNAVFGNLTFYADLPTYRDQIESRYQFGDFDDDAQLTVADLNLLTDATRSGQSEIAFDLNRDLVVDGEDRRIWVEDLKGTSFGDTNLDGFFESQDIILVMQAGEYEKDMNGLSTWGTGDWNGDSAFDSADFVLAFQSGTYEQGPEESDRRGALVPEPTGLIGLLGPVLYCLGHLRRRRPASHHR